MHYILYHILCFMGKKNTSAFSVFMALREGGRERKIEVYFLTFSF